MGEPALPTEKNVLRSPEPREESQENSLKLEGLKTERGRRSNEPPKKFKAREPARILKRPEAGKFAIREKKEQEKFENEPKGEAKKDSLLRGKAREGKGAHAGSGLK